MYGSGAYRPLHHPKPRRRDRRAGARSEHRNAALLEKPLGRQPGWRPPGDKRRALDRLLARIGSGRERHSLVVIGLLAVPVLVAFGLRAALWTPDPKPFAAHAAAYERLAAVTFETCGVDPCWLARGISPSPHVEEGKRLMTELRVLRVRHEPAFAETRFLGTEEASVQIVHDWPEARVSEAAGRGHRTPRSRAPDAWRGGWRVAAIR